MRNIWYGLLALFVIGIVTAGTVSAFGGFGFGGDREAIDSAIDSGDYTTWRSLMEDQLTEENFNQLQEMHQNGFGRMGEDKGNDAAREAIEANDYEAWLAAMEEGCASNVELTEDDFNTLVAIHDARESGDFELANELAEESGLDMGPHHGGMRGDMQGKMAGQITE